MVIITIAFGLGMTAGVILEFLLLQPKLRAAEKIISERERLSAKMESLGRAH